MSLTHWRGEENPADGLTKSLKPLSLWTNLVDAVGLVPGPNEKGQNWIKNFLTQVKKEEELKEESLKEFARLKLDPNVRSKKGSSKYLHQLCMSHTFSHVIFPFLIVSSFIRVGNTFIEKRCDV